MRLSESKNQSSGSQTLIYYDLHIKIYFKNYSYIQIIYHKLNVLVLKMLLDRFVSPMTDFCSQSLIYIIHIYIHYNVCDSVIYVSIIVLGISI